MDEELGEGKVGGGSDVPDGGGSSGQEPESPKTGSRLWPIFITLGLALVVLVNAIFIYIAVSGADEVVPSYVTEER